MSEYPKVCCDLIAFLYEQDGHFCYRDEIPDEFSDDAIDAAGHHGLFHCANPIAAGETTGWGVRLTPGGVSLALKLLENAARVPSTRSVAKPRKTRTMKHTPWQNTVLKAVADHSGNFTQAAIALGKDRTTVREVFKTGCSNWKTYLAELRKRPKTNRLSQSTNETDIPHDRRRGREGGPVGNS